MTYDLDFYKIYVPLLDKPIDRVKEILDRGFREGWSTTRDGDLNKCVYYGALTDHNPKWTVTEEAIADLMRNRDGSITIFTEYTDFSFAFCETWPDDNLNNLGGVTLTWDRVHFNENPQIGTQDVLEASMLVFEELSPSFAFSQLPYQFERETPVTRTDLEDHRLPDVFWLMLLSKPIVEQFGRDRLMEAPVWKSVSLGNGGVGLVNEEWPFGYTEADKLRVKSALGFDT